MNIEFKVVRRVSVNNLKFQSVISFLCSQKNIILFMADAGAVDIPFILLAGKRRMQ
ncbi:MAG: hypothetical protein HDR80_04905, partial [Bacteroides sp.]|nr:hypothetical protein [Bacteroides sp.]